MVSVQSGNKDFVYDITEILFGIKQTSLFTGGLNQSY